MICPLDSEPLTLQERTLVCKSGHSFDLAKTGYANLLPVQNKRSKDPGDNKAMVVARQAFLNSQAYLPIAAKLNDIVKAYAVQKPNNQLRLLDAGCGEGYYLSYLAQQADYELVSSIGLDISKWAVTAASKRNKSLSWLVASNGHLPMPDNRVDSILCLFGFPVWTEFERVLSEQGFIVVADSGEDHLIELRQVLYPEIHPYKAPDYSQIDGLELVKTESLRFAFDVKTNQELMNLLAMTPHRHKAPYQGLKAVEELTELSLTADVTFTILQKSKVASTLGE